MVGDGLVGKTGLIQKFIRGDFIPEYVATLKDEYTTKLRASGDVYDLHVTDLAGEHEDLSSLPNPDVFIVCFSLVDKDSLDNVEQFWMPRIRSLGKDIPVILVGTQLDMRKTNEQGHVSDEQGKFFAKQLKTNHYIECSAKMDFKIQDVFEKAVYAKIRHSKRKSNIIRRVFGRWHQT